MKETMATQWGSWICAEGAEQLVSSLTAGKSIRKEDLRSRQGFSATAQALTSSCATCSREKTIVPWVTASVWTCCQLTSFPWGQVDSSWAGAQFLKSSAWSSWSEDLSGSDTSVNEAEGTQGLHSGWIVRSQLFGHLKLRWHEWWSLYFWMQISVQIINVVLLAHLKKSLGGVFLSTWVQANAKITLCSSTVSTSLTAEHYECQYDCQNCLTPLP